MKLFTKRIIILILIMMTLINVVVPSNCITFATEESTSTEGKELFYYKSVEETIVQSTINGVNSFEGSIGVDTGNGTEKWYVFTVAETGNYVFLDYAQNSPDKGIIFYEYKKGTLEEIQSGEDDYVEDVEMQKMISGNGKIPSGTIAYHLEAGTQYIISEFDWGYYLTNGSIAVAPEDNVETTNTVENSDASLIERLITVFLLTVGDGAMWAIGAVAGGDISLDALFFNEYTNTTLSLFDGQKYTIPNKFINDSGVKDVINWINVCFRAIAITAYTVILLYIGIRILLGCTAGAKAKYKELLLDWVRGLVILFIFPIIMKYIIELNDAAVSALNDVKVVTMPNSPGIVEKPGGITFPLEFGGTMAEKPQDYMENLRYMASQTGRALYALCWLILIFEIVKFIFIYFKRLLVVIFLIAVFPLVMIYYALDKIKDGRAQVFENWFKEFVINVVLQTFHALNYIVVMGIVTSVGGLDGSDMYTKANYILILVGITYIAKGEEILRHIFGQDNSKAGTVKSAAESMIKAKAIVDITKKIGKSFKKTSTRFATMLLKGRAISDRHLMAQQHRIDEREDALANAGGLPLEAFYDFNRNGNNGGGISDGVRKSILSATGATSPAELKKALGKLSAMACDPLVKEELAMQLAKMGASGQEIKDMLESYEAAEGIRLNIDVKQNLDILIKRKKGKNGLASSKYVQMRKDMLDAYGYTEESLVEERKKIVKKTRKLEKTNEKRIKTSSMLKNSRTRLSYAKASNATAKDSNKSQSKKKNYKLANSKVGQNATTGQKATASKITEQQTMGQQTTGQKNTTSKQVGIKTDPIKRTYVKNEIVGKRRTTAQKTRTRKAVEKQRRENVEKLTDKAVEIRRKTTGSVATAEQREKYAKAAEHIQDINNPESTPTTILRAQQQFNDVVSQIKALQGLKTREKAEDVSVLQSEIKNTTKASEIAGERMKVIKQIETEARNAKADEINRNSETFTPTVSYRDVATAVNTMNDGRATLNELWEARDTYAKAINENSADVGIQKISEHFFGGSGVSMEEYTVNLAVQTLNNTYEIEGNAREKQQIVDRCIDIVKEGAIHSNSVTSEVIGGLKYDLNSLKKGQLPSNIGQTPETPSATKEIEKALSELRGEMRGTGTQWEPGKKYDAEKEKKKMRQELHSLGVDVVKEVVKDTAAITAAGVATSAYLALDETVTPTEFATAVSLGASGGAKLGAGAVQVVDNTSYRIKKGIKSISNDRKRNPVQLYNDNGTVKQKKN